MIRRRQILINALMSVVQVVVIGGSFFVLYRFVKDTIGIAQFGVWSVVLATTSASNIANLGLATSTVKFVSMYLARDQPERVARIVQTAILSLGAVLALVLVAIYPLLQLIIKAAIDPELFPVALSILPYAVISFWLNAVAGVVQSSVDGCHRVDLRGVWLMIGALVYLGLAFLLVPTRGLIGLAQAQALQAGILLLAFWILLARLLPTLPWFPFRWDRNVFKEMLRYSVTFQAISATSLLFEPVTKLFVMRFGGATASGYFEFAHRLVIQVRALLVTAHRSLVPAIADLQERQPELIRALYVRSYRLLLYLLLFILPLCLMLTPFISWIWVGTYQPTFVLFANLLFVGWFLNILSGPAYFANLGTGELRWNLIGHLLTGVLNAGLGLLLGWLYGGTGVVVSYMLAIIVGSMTTALAYQRYYHIRGVELFQRESLWLGAATLAGVVVALVLYTQLAASWSLPGMSVLIVGIYLAIIAVPVWKHPARRELQHWLFTYVLRRPSESQISQ